MPLIALCAKYTPENLAAARKQGYATREEAMRSVAGQYGGSVVATYWPSSAQWDFICIADLPSVDDGFALAGHSNASGAFARVEAVQLWTSAEADAATTRSIDWTPPAAS